MGVDLLKRVGMPDCRPGSTPSSTGEKLLVFEGASAKLVGGDAGLVAEGECA